MKTYDFCIPTRGTRVPHTPDWLHEIKYDGYRLRLERNGDRVRLFTRNGYDWTKRYPWIVESALKNRQRHFVIDGEAVILGVAGRSDFDALHSGKHNDEVQLYAFDMLAGDGDDLRQLPLSMRKANLARLLARRTEGIFIAPFETKPGQRWPLAARQDRKRFWTPTGKPPAHICATSSGPRYRLGNAGADARPCSDHAADRA